MSIIIIKSGYPNFKGGRTILELNTTGEVKIQNEYKGEKQRLNEYVSIDDKLVKLISSLAPILKNWKYSNRKGMPDEALYEVEIFDVGRKHAVMKFNIWHNDLKSVPVIEEMFKFLKNLVKEVTKQKVIL